MHLRPRRPKPGGIKSVTMLGNGGGRRWSGLSRRGFRSEAPKNPWCILRYKQLYILFVTAQAKKVGFPPLAGRVARNVRGMLGIIPGRSKGCRCGGKQGQCDTCFQNFYFLDIGIDFSYSPARTLKYRFRPTGTIVRRTPVQGICSRPQEVRACA